MASFPHDLRGLTSGGVDGVDVGGGGVACWSGIDGQSSSDDDGGARGGASLLHGTHTIVNVGKA